VLDIILPIPAANADLVDGFVYALSDSTKAEFRVIAILDGGTQREVGMVQKALGPVDHLFLHEPVPVDLPRCIQECLKHVRQQMVAIMRPEVRTTDEKWVGKIRRIFEVDPQTAVIDTAPNTTSSSMAPTKRAIHRPAPDGVRFAILSGRFAKALLLAPTTDPIVHASAIAMRTACSCWHHGGVNYYLTEHKEHQIWRAPSAAEAPSRSPSPTTPASSTRTTTARGGSTDFDL